jgi:hypothetical protein
MGLKIAELNALTDEEVIAAYDQHAKHFAPATGFWMEELERRSRERSTLATNRLSRNSYVLAIVSTVIAVLALAVSVVTLIVSV